MGHKALFPQGIKAVPVHIAARRVGGAVRPVGAEAEQAGVLQAPQALRRCQGQFLVPPAETLARQVDDGLAPGEEGQLPSLLRVVRNTVS